MIIGIDISSTQYGTGVSNYTLNLVKNLVKLDKENIYKLFFCSLRNPLPEDINKLRSDNVKIYHLKFPIKLLIFLWNHLNILPVELFIGKCNIFHTSDYYHTPSIKAKLVTTVHDLTAFLYPQWLHPAIVRNHQLRFKHINNYSHFICVSKTTQTDLLKTFSQINPKITSIVYESSEEKYKKFAILKAKHKKLIINRFKQKYLLNNFLLAQGTREPRKNLQRLIKAFISFKESHPKSDLELAITGKYGWGQDIDINQPTFIKILGYLPEPDMVAAHAASKALIYPSLYEGFGLPILKAMAVGTPVITSLNTSMSEIAGNTAILVNPKSTSDIKKAIEKIDSKSFDTTKFSQKSIQLASKFSWSQTAQKTLDIYRKINI